ncbi:butyrophilin subfamily 3 member A2-like [Chaetodon auriga]|uniref:butyrophilin subfamily 3 member A2-like n=1 Tax=Chaetodon auriga TaxID=39042 RepID=UPI004032A8B9
MAESLLLVFVSSCLLVSVASVAGESDVIGSHEPVKVVVGDDAILPCHLEPPFDVHNLTVEWRCSETLVHIYRHEGDGADLQGENYKGRTSLFLEEMTRGNISLKLTNVSERDAGKYTCHIPELVSQVRRGDVTLIVEPVDKSTGGNQTDDQQDDQGGDGGGGEEAGVNIAVIIIVIAISVAIALIIRNAVSRMLLLRRERERRRRQRMERERRLEPRPDSVQLNDEQNTS